VIKGGIPNHIPAPLVSVSDTGDVVIWVVKIIVLEKQKLVGPEIRRGCPRSVGISSACKVLVINGKDVSGPDPIIEFRMINDAKNVKGDENSVEVCPFTVVHAKSRPVFA
jgi:hypothetical protein